MTTETLSKLYLELANVVPETTRSSRELSVENQVKQALRILDELPPEEIDGTLLQAVNRLRSAIRKGPIPSCRQPSRDIS